jgi:hypothetical protein
MMRDGTARAGFLVFFTVACLCYLFLNNLEGSTSSVIRNAIRNHAGELTPFRRLKPVSQLNPPSDMCMFSPETRRWYDPIYRRLESDLRKYSNMNDRQRTAYIEQCKTNINSCTFVSIRESQIRVVQNAIGFETRNIEILDHLWRVVETLSPLPDVDFAIDHDDGLRDTGGLPIFMLSNYQAAPQGIMIPDFTFYDWSTSRCPGEISRAFVNFMANASARLDDLRSNPSGFVASKINDVFWRGAPLQNNKRKEQLDVLYSKPDLPPGVLNTKMLDWQTEGCVTMHDHCTHRYLIHFQGNTYSSRLKYLLLCGSLVIMPQQEYEEWWYPAIPSRDIADEDNEILLHVKDDLSDFNQKFSGVYHETEISNRTLSLSRRALEFANEVFSQKSVDCYWGSVIIGAAKAWGRILPADQPGRPLELVREHIWDQFSEM